MDLKIVLEKHEKWLNDEKGGERADLWGADLCGADLRGANLREANLCGVNLRGANLRGANLWGADLWGANLRKADLWGADLRGANLRKADLNVKNPPTNSHRFIAEILFRESKSFKERSWAGCIMISTDWCWGKFLKEAPKEAIIWAKEILCSKWPEFEEKFREAT